MKKITLKVLPLLFIPIIGCATTKEIEPSRFDTMVQLENNPATGETYDFNKMKIVICDWWTDPNIQPITEKEKSDYEWKQFLNSRYNMNIMEKAVADWGSIPNFIETNCKANNNNNYVLVVDFRTAFKGIQNGWFYDLSTIKTVNYHDDSKYDQIAVNLFSNGESFYSFNLANQTSINNTGVFFNKRILAENGYSDDYLYDLQKDGKWTWETFEEICSNISKNIEYPLAAFMNSFFTAAVASNNAPSVGIDEKGKLINNIGSDSYVEAMKWIQNMAFTYMTKQKAGENWNYFYDDFIFGEAAFLIAPEYDAETELLKMNEDFGFLCFPTGPKGKAFSSDCTTNMMVIPAVYGKDKAEKIAKAIDLYLTSNPDYPWKETIYNYFSDKRAVDETIEYLIKNSITDYSKFFPNKIISPIEPTIVWPTFDNNNNPETLCSQVKDSWDTVINQWNEGSLPSL